MSGRDIPVIIEAVVVFKLASSTYRRTASCLLASDARDINYTKLIVVYSSSLPQIRRQRELPRTSEVCPYITKDLILRTSEVSFPRG